jgi:RND family efflux transporter MFP subunit
LFPDVGCTTCVTVDVPAGKAVEAAAEKANISPMKIPKERSKGARPARLLVTRGTIELLVVVSVAVVAGCGGSGADATTASDSSGASRSANPGVENGRPALPTMAVAVQPADRGSIATYYKATASLDPDKLADILARTSGVVERLLTEEGDRVAAGQALLHLEDDEYLHRKALAEADVDQHRLRFERAEQLLDQGLTSTEAFETARRDLRSAEAALKLAALELSYTKVRAPFDGRVVRRWVDLGQTVSNGVQLFTLADMSRLLARVHVPAKEFRSIRTDQPVELVVTSTGDRLTGRIDLVNPMVDPSSGTIKVTVEITDYPPTTRPGDFVEVSIVTDRHTDALLVPRVAVVSERGERKVYVVEGEVATQRQVEIGFEDDAHAEVLSGIDDGDLVVVQGQRALRDGQPVNVLDRIDLDDVSQVSTEPADRRAG